MCNYRHEGKPERNYCVYDNLKISNKLDKEILMMWRKYEGEHYWKANFSDWKRYMKAENDERVRWMQAKCSYIASMSHTPLILGYLYFKLFCGIF